MITNFDSTEQKKRWLELTKPTSSNDEIPDISDMWIRNSTCRPCERLLNDRTEIATYFAGIIRTAFMYCRKIMLSDAQLFDGLFFLALGPTTVNGILGKSYKDGPVIIVSGRQNTLEECLKAFTISTVGAVQDAASHADESIRPSSTYCAGTASQHTIRPLEYCAFDHTVTRAEALGLSKSFYDTLDDRLAHVGENGLTMSTVIAQTYAAALHPDGDEQEYYRFLAQRWQEWIDAEKQGLILYENQNDERVRQRANSDGFTPWFERYAQQYAPMLAKRYHLDSKTSGTQCSIFTAALTAISSMPKRSDAFMCINRTKLPEHCVADAGQAPLSKTMLRDWYQFVYQRALARHLGAYLIAVDAPPNSFEQIAGSAGKTDGSSLMLAGVITKQLGDMPFNRFSTFCYESRSTIERWRRCDPSTPKREQRLSTRNVAYSVQQASEERSLMDDGKNILFGAGLAALLALLTALSDNVWLNGNAPIWLIVFVAWLLGMVPNFVDVLKWIRGVRSSSKTVVYLA
ncbi:hypothetical protein BLEM_1309 [Bifidobacterium lemurum]|uniref:Uncharacterized protein n=2 Tax=Bifidobacterium lemurum TaxID=1603886 RepID=A0A261FRF8_9BIFI|nr:hypothetical protein BLEM_1309 [Bifidobacterium lemurum]